MGLIYWLLVLVGVVLVATPLASFAGSFIAASIDNDSDASYEDGAHIGNMVGIILGAILVIFGVAGLTGGV